MLDSIRQCARAARYASPRSPVSASPPFGFLHVDRPNRPPLAPDLMEELRPWLADRIAITPINRQQIQPDHFTVREGGAVEFTYNKSVFFGEKNLIEDAGQAGSGALTARLSPSAPKTVQTKRLQTDLNKTKL